MLFFYFIISDVYVSQSKHHYDHVPVKSAENFKSPGNSDKFYNGYLHTRSFDESVVVSFFISSNFCFSFVFGYVNVYLNDVETTVSIHIQICYIS